MTTPQPIEPTDVMQGRGNRRLALSHEHLLVEVLGPGRRWTPARAIHLMDIRAAYSYEAKDWSPVAVAVLVWIILACVVATVGVMLSWPGPVIALVVAVGLALLLGASIYRVTSVPKRLLRIEAYSGPLVFPNLDQNGFFRRLDARLAMARGPVGTPVQPAPTLEFSPTPQAAIPAPEEVPPEPSASVDPEVMRDVGPAAEGPQVAPAPSSSDG